MGNLLGHRAESGSWDGMEKPHRVHVYGIVLRAVGAAGALLLEENS